MILPLQSGRAADLTLPMLTALGKDSFLSLTKFLLHVLHNIIANPHKKAYRKMKTASRVSCAWTGLHRSFPNPSTTSSSSRVHSAFCILPLQTVMAALQKPATIDLLKVLNMRKEDEYYIMDDDPVDVAKLEVGVLPQPQTKPRVPPTNPPLQEIMNAIIATRKRLNVLEAWEVFPTDIVRNDLLGAGTFGEVYSGWSPCRAVPCCGVRWLCSEQPRSSAQPPNPPRLSLQAPSRAAMLR